MAPIYDSGASLCCEDIEMRQIKNQKREFIEVFGKSECMPFNSFWKDQLKHITDLGWLPTENLTENIAQIIHTSYEPVVQAGLREASAIDTLIRSVTENAEHIVRIAQELHSGDFTQSM